MVLTESQKTAIENPHASEQTPVLGAPEVGYEDIASDTPYIDFDYDGDKAIIHILYMPPELREKGFGKAMVTQWFRQLDKSITHVTLKACTLGSGYTKAFWSLFGFESAYYGCTDTADGDATDILVVGVNGHETPPPTELIDGQSAHYIFGVMD